MVVEEEEEEEEAGEVGVRACIALGWRVREWSQVAGNPRMVRWRERRRERECACREEEEGRGMDGWMDG